LARRFCERRIYGLLLNARKPHSFPFYVTDTRPEPRIRKLHPDPIAFIGEHLQHGINSERYQRFPCCSGVQINGGCLNDNCTARLSRHGGDRSGSHEKENSQYALPPDVLRDLFAPVGAEPDVH
jgi:hypothetical protein